MTEQSTLGGQMLCEDTNRRINREVERESQSMGWVRKNYAKNDEQIETELVLLNILMHLIAYSVIRIYYVPLWQFLKDEVIKINYRLKEQ